MTMVPGDEVGTAEEFVPSVGVFEERGRLFASRVGVLEADRAAHSAKVAARTRVPRLQREGSVALGIVAKVTENTALVDLAPSRAKNMESVPQGISAVLHVSNVRQGFVQRMQDELKEGDIVKVRVLEVSPHTVRLTTAAPGLGVVKAFCSKCRHALQAQGERLSCPRCGSIETRKLAIKGGDTNADRFQDRPQERGRIRRQRR